MRRISVPPRGLLLLALMLTALPALAQVDIQPKDLWSQATAANASGDMQQRDAKVNALHVTASSLGVKRFPLFADSAASLALQMVHEKNASGAAWAMSTAKKLDPLSPDIDFTAADIARLKGNWPGVASSLGNGMQHLFWTYRSRTLAGANLVLAICIALGAAAAVFALILFIRYSRRARHDISELLAPRFGAGMTTTLAFAALLLPLFLWLGPMWLVLYWLAIFFGYATAKERVVIVILLLLVAATPIMTDWSSYRIAGVNSPVVQAAVSNIERSYNIEASRRLRELIDAVPNEPRLRLLLGNLEAQHGNEDEASVQYRKAIEIDDNFAGAHLNLGNLHFLVNEMQAASLEYEKASKSDSTLAIADYNSSVASGEQYKFDQQGSQLESAKRKNRAIIESLLAHPPPQKIVRYELPMATAWAIADRIARSGAARDVYGNYAWFDPLRSALNPLTLGAIVFLLFGFGLLYMNRKFGFAGECIKCGRTYCHRCKSSRESAIYCTQCIHIYLKRDGVALDTKRSKVAEVHDYQTAALRRRKMFATVLPGSAQVLEGSTIRGLIFMLLFLFFVAIAILIGRAAPIATPAETWKLLLRTVAIAIAVVSWFMMSLPVYRQKFLG